MCTPFDLGQGAVVAIIVVSIAFAISLSVVGAAIGNGLARRR